MVYRGMYSIIYISIHLAILLFLNKWSVLTTFIPLKEYRSGLTMLFFKQIGTYFLSLTNTVEPVLNGTVLSGHPLVSGQLTKSQKFLPLYFSVSTR